MSGRDDGYPDPRESNEDSKIYILIIEKGELGVSVEVFRNEVQAKAFAFDWMNCNGNFQRTETVWVDTRQNWRLRLESGRLK